MIAGAITAGASALLVADAGGAVDIAVDACTLNNALNVAQLVVLVALLRWVRPAP